MQTKITSQGLKRQTNTKITNIRDPKISSQGKKKDKLLSMMLKSLEKRFRIRPTGLLLKNRYLARIIRSSILE